MEHGQQLRQDYGASTSSDVQQTAAAMTPMSSMLRLALRAIVHAEADEKLCSDWLAGDTEALQTWAQNNQQPVLAELCTEFAAHSQSGITRLLNGPTGERNSYAILPREHVLCLAEVESDLLTQLAAVLAVGRTRHGAGGGGLRRPGGPADHAPRARVAPPAHLATAGQPDGLRRHVRRPGGGAVWVGLGAR